MGSFLVFNFDGTGNEPEDANQEAQQNDIKEDESISNILKLHLMMGGNLFNTGDLYGKSSLSAIDHCFYYQGVGTYGSKIRRLLNQGLALEHHDVASILNKAVADFKNCYQHGDIVLITGFSRGAALARRFIHLISEQVIDTNVRPFIFLCAFDTVASFGLPNLSTSSRPKYDVIFEHGCSLSPMVKQATHLVSLDEKRRAFQPTLMNYEPERIREIWFAGSHSDIGGGYYHDGLSDLSLEFVIQWLEYMEKDHGLPLIMLFVPNQQQLDTACPNQLQNKINAEDIELIPNPLGLSHQQDRGAFLNWLTLDDRVCGVIEKEAINKNKKPIIHHSVATRIRLADDYQPVSLFGIAHNVWYEFDSPLDYDVVN